MVELRVHREAAVTETFDQMRLPQRPMPVEQRSVQPGREFQQFAHPSWRGQRRASQVVFEIEVAVEGPSEVGYPAEQFSRVFAKRRRDVIATDQLLIQTADVIRPGVLRWLEQLQPGNMHGVLT